MSTAVFGLLITRAGSLSAAHKESALCSYAAYVSRPAAAWPGAQLEVTCEAVLINTIRLTQQGQGLLPA